jgi:lysine 2,3-aminomutase
MTGARRLAELVDAGLLTPERADALARVAERYALALTPYLIETLAGRPADDPLVRQYIPDEAEIETTAAERADPIGDHAFSPVKGIVHRYPDRVLLKPLHACAVYCRFCFRRSMVGPGGEALSETELAAALDYIASHPEVWEVVLTGGDPLMLSPRRLAALAGAVAAIPHVETLRLHTRVPLTDPGRVTPELVDALRHEGAATWVALHANHAGEFTPPVKAAVARLADAGIPLLGQTVLLKGVNDDAGTLEALFRAMVRNRIKPYYLHHTDLAPGTGHFRTTIEHGRDLVDALRGRVSGVCQPAYVLDIPGGHGKAPVARSWYDEESGTVRDYRGRAHGYEG